MNAAWRDKGGRELPCRCRLGAGQVQEHVQMRLDGQTGRGRQGMARAGLLGAGWVLVWSGLLREPPSRKQECAINWPEPWPRGRPLFSCGCT